MFPPGSGFFITTEAVEGRNHAHRDLRLISFYLFPPIVGGASNGAAYGMPGAGWGGGGGGAAMPGLPGANHSPASNSWGMPAMPTALSASPHLGSAAVHGESRENSLLYIYGLITLHLSSFIRFYSSSPSPISIHPSYLNVCIQAAQMSQFPWLYTHLRYYQFEDNVEVVCLGSLMSSCGEPLMLTLRNSCLGL